MKIRCVVTGHSNEGKSVVTSDEVISAIGMPGSPETVFRVLWGADTTQTYPNDGTPPEHDGWWPPVGGFRVLIWETSPDNATDNNLQETQVETEMERLMPGVVELMEPDNPGFHKSDTTDLLYVVSGRAILQLDDGIEVELKAGDFIVQNGTRHAWRTPDNESCTIIDFMIGARRST